MVLFASPGAPSGAGKQADVAQLVERNLAKVEVASSSLVVRSERVSSPSSGGLAERRGNGLQIRVHGFKSRTHLAASPFPRAIGAAVARFLDTEEVTGSNPVSPTSTKQPLTCINAGSGAFVIHPRVGFVSDGPAHRRDLDHHRHPRADPRRAPRPGARTAPAGTQPDPHRRTRLRVLDRARSAVAGPAVAPRYVAPPRGDAPRSRPGVEPLVSLSPSTTERGRRPAVPAQTAGGAHPCPTYARR